MIILFTAGRLGNQIFQYGFANKLTSSNEYIITSKCEYFDVFKYDKNKYVFFNKYVRFIVIRILNALSTMRIVSIIEQNYTHINGYYIDIDSYHYKKGLFDTIKVVKGFYQSEKFIDYMPRINQRYRQEASEYLKNIPKSMQKVFIHIRRGDYIEFSVLGKSNPSLPLSYYKSAIVDMNNNLSNPFYIFLSDDIEYIKKEFSYIDNKKISNNSVGIDIAIMQKCEYAILSNSSLSWCGANLMNKKRLIFAPKYWLGWKSETWFPKGIDAQFMKYIKIKK